MDTKVRTCGRLVAALLLLAAGCGKPAEPWKPASETEGYASWYGPKFQGRKTASGEIYDQNALTAAHRTAPFGTLFEVTHARSGRTVTVRVNDRGPFVKGRIVDLSYAAAQAIGMVATGTAPVRLRPVGASPAPETVPGEFVVQVGSFREAANAARMAEELRRRFPSLRAQVVPAEEFHRVFVGPFPDPERAEAERTRLERDGYDGLVLRR